MYNKRYTLFLQAYQKWVNENPNVDKRLPGLSNYTQEQMFFIGYAHGWCAKFTDEYARHRILTDVHSIAQFRYEYIFLLFEWDN